VAAAATARALMALDLEPQFDRPYLSASLRDFWGRRWNLSVPALLRQCVFRPVRARLGAPAGVLAAFVVSGLMHEAMFSYITLRPPTGEEAAFLRAARGVRGGGGVVGRARGVAAPTARPGHAADTGVRGRDGFLALLSADHEARR